MAGERGVDAGAVAGAADLLLEVGSEEIPARFLPAALAELEARAGALLDELDLEHGRPRVFGTPRRLALLCPSVAQRQPDRTLEVKGPPVRVAFDAEGRPTRAAEGFARQNGVEVADCFTVTEGKGEYLAARRAVRGRAAPEVLAERLPGLVLGLPFPKVMRWGEGEVEYPRPLRWLVALHGAEPIPLAIGDLVADRRSRGHRTLAGDRTVEIEAPARYLERLREHGVEPDPRRRRELIVAGLAAAAAELPGAAAPVPDEELLEEVVHLCEHPTVFAGAFEPEFFELPEEVIVTALRQHQRYFAVRAGGDGGLLPSFLGVRDGGDLALDQVRRGNERVLRARLADALFYWRFDQKRSPDEQVERLGSVTWIEGLGSMLDRTRRLEELAPDLWRAGLGDDGPPPPELARAAHLAKSDLVTEMIRDGKEFTKLEGVIGARYARQAGESEAVCRAIERHNLPRGATDELPGDRISSTLGAADRLDILAGCWLAGFAPTGAKDPYGLRRHALALLRIVLDLGARLGLRAQLRRALRPYGGEEAALAAAEEGLAGFLGTRLAVHLVESQGCSGEAVRAVLPAHGDDPTAALAWARDLEGFRRREDFLQLATGFKRCKNILEGRVLDEAARQGSLERWLAGGRTPEGRSLAELPEPAERELRRQVAAAARQLTEADEAGDRVAALRALSGLGPAIDAFFDAVRVNVADEGLRDLRHAFLREIHGLFARYADFGEVAPAEGGRE